MDDAIPLAVPQISGREWTYVRECLDTGWVSSAGAFVDRFEAEFAAAVDADHAVALVNGTAALHLALRLAGVGPGDEVIVPALTFVATANAVRYLDAWPVFVDCDPHHLQLTPEALRRFLDEACDPGPVHRRTGRRVRAVVPVHALGHPCDVDGLTRVAAAHGLAVVEDAAEALGSRHRGRPVGSGSRLAAFSFNGNKIVTTGGGGMLVTDDADLAGRARYLSTQAKDDAVRYVHGEIGYNYRLTNVQAAIGVAQLERLDAFVDAKRTIAARYADGLGEVAGLRLPDEAPWARSNFWMYSVFIDRAHTALDPDAVIARLAGEGIQARRLWQPLHMSPAHGDAPAARCPHAEAAWATGVSLPCSTGLAPAEQDRVIGVLHDLFTASP